MVVSFTVFQHIPQVAVIESYLVEAVRVLRPGGLFVFQWNSTPGERRWMARRSWLWLLHRVGLRTNVMHAPQFLGSRLDVSRVRPVLDGAGMDLEATSGEGTLWTWAWARRRASSLV
jgi:SAM-dependent methyltransferase